MRPIKTILVPTDYSQRSEHALTLACAHGARLIALHVVVPPSYYGESNRPVPSPKSLRQGLNGWVSRHREGGAMPLVESRVEEGFASDAILRMARERHCDLIVIGSRGKTGVERAMLGSVAQDVARRSPCPVLISEGPAPGAFEGGMFEPLFSTILFPTDLSGRSHEAYPMALALAGPGTRLIALHVRGAVQVMSEDGGTTLDERLRTLHPAGPGVHMEYRAGGGGPFDEVLRMADESRCDLIVMTSHGRTGLDRLLMGSVAEAVFHGARCPVLIVRTARPETGSEVEVTGPKSVLVF